MERPGLACVGRGLASYPLALRGTQQEIQPDSATSASLAQYVAKAYSVITVADRKHEAWCAHWSSVKVPVQRFVTDFWSLSLDQLICKTGSNGECSVLESPRSHRWVDKGWRRGLIDTSRSSRHETV